MKHLTQAGALIATANAADLAAKHACHITLHNSSTRFRMHYRSDSASLATLKDWIEVAIADRHALRAEHHNTAAHQAAHAGDHEGANGFTGKCMQQLCIAMDQQKWAGVRCGGCGAAGATSCLLRACRRCHATFYCSRCKPCALAVFLSLAVFWRHLPDNQSMSCAAVH